MWLFVLSLRESVSARGPVFSAVRHLIDVDRVWRVRGEVVVGVVTGRENFSIGNRPTGEFPRATNAGRDFPVTDGRQVAFVVKRQTRGGSVEERGRARPVGVHFFFL